MRPLLALSNAIDLLNQKLGVICNFLILAACVVSAANAMIRYAFGYSSNSWLELQWYMFAILVMFGASYTFKRNEHVRVEILYLMLPERGQREGDGEADQHAYNKAAEHQRRHHVQRDHCTGLSYLASIMT